MKTASIETVVALIDGHNATQPVKLEFEIERNWVWLTTDLAPLHKKCECQTCTERAAARKAIGKDGMGFIYAANGHALPSGQVSYWAHHCQHPIRFKRKGKAGKPEDQTSQQPTEDGTMTDEQLAALLG